MAGMPPLSKNATDAKKSRKKKRVGAATGLTSATASSNKYTAGDIVKVRSKDVGLSRTQSSPDRHASMSVSDQEVHEKTAEILAYMRELSLKGRRIRASNGWRPVQVKIPARPSARMISDSSVDPNSSTIAPAAVVGADGSVRTGGRSMPTQNSEPKTRREKKLRVGRKENISANMPLIWEHQEEDAFTMVANNNADEAIVHSIESMSVLEIYSELRKELTTCTRSQTVLLMDEDEDAFSNPMAAGRYAQAQHVNCQIEPA